MHLKYTSPPPVLPCTVLHLLSRLFRITSLLNTTKHPTKHSYHTSRRYFLEPQTIVYTTPLPPHTTPTPTFHFTSPNSQFPPTNSSIPSCNCTPTPTSYTLTLTPTPISTSTTILPPPPSSPPLPRLSKTSSPHFHLHRLLTSCLFCIY